MTIADDYNTRAGQGNNHFVVTGSEEFNARTQVLACTVACEYGQAEVHVHFAHLGNGIETGANIRNMSAPPGIWNFNPGSHLANACIAYARLHRNRTNFPF